MDIWEYVLLFSSVMAGGLVAFYFKQSNQKVLQTIMSFSGAYILGITVLHFLPTVFKSADSHIGIYILLGFVIQLVLEQLSVGIEHGHIHPAHKGKNQFAFQVMIGLCVHAFIEGLPLGKYETIMHVHEHSSHANHLLFSIILHKIPAAFALVVLLLLSKFKNSTVLFCMLFFASMSPLGSIIGESLNLDAEMIRILLAIVVGSFLHIATTIIFEIDGSQNHHHFSMTKMVAILGGIGLAVLSA